MIETTVGRTFVHDIIPECLHYDDINKVLNKKELGKLLDKAYRRGSEKDTVLLADAIMQTGYSYATKAGISINVKDMVIPKEKEGIIQLLKTKLIKSQMNITKDQSLTVRDTIRSSMFGHKPTRNFLKL